ncbi:ArdC family protein [Exiguobacterium antarcticum]|uniref:ArdC family protein n=1 Tax=Exiguobacterium antarcticum TaxID=132920 RepID=A0ABT6R5X0_9BACL|nr:ArdC family protein [Exiguobacterium antarcticum]MDI3236172.1 ArdC family protein [Exiguobacterium antarcticum]
MAVKTKAKETKPTNQVTIDDASRMLEENITKIFDEKSGTANYQEFLKVMSRVPNYSARNLLLIANQKPDATIVMGYKEWQKLGRNVTKGESSLRILAPIIKDVEKQKLEGMKNVTPAKGGENPNSDKVKMVVGYRLVPVFDVSQTEGKPLITPQMMAMKALANDEETSKLYNDFKVALNDKKLPVREEDLSTDPEFMGRKTGGYYQRGDHFIVINTDSKVNENDSQKFDVLIHEYAHAKLHHKDSELKNLPTGHKEAQAESVAFVVNHYYGRDTGDSSNGYIAQWAKDPKLAIQAIGEIQTAAVEIIEEINELQKEKILEATKESNKDHDLAKQYLIDSVGLKESSFEAEKSTQSSLQLINKEHGYVLSGSLEHNEKNDTWYIRTNRQIIEPLHELDPEKGKFAVLNVEKEQGELKEYKAYSRIAEHFKVSQVKEGVYVVQSAPGRDLLSISREFNEPSHANEFIKRSSMAQALHEHTTHAKMLEKGELKTELNQTNSEIISAVNKQVGEYLGHHSSKKVTLHEQSGVKIGWAMIRNPSLKTVDDLHQEADQKKHLVSGKDLLKALNQIDVQEISKSEKGTKKVVRENVNEQERER